MSRHRVKSLEADIDDDDVDDYDGGYEDDSQMQESLAKARAVLGPEFTDTEIQDSLWHYYYDVEKTVNYLLSENCIEATEMASSLITKKIGRVIQSRKAQMACRKRPKVGFIFHFSFCLFDDCLPSWCELSQYAPLLEQDFLPTVIDGRKSTYPVLGDLSPKPRLGISCQLLFGLSMACNTRGASFKSTAPSQLLWWSVGRVFAGPSQTIQACGSSRCPSEEGWSGGRCSINEFCGSARQTRSFKGHEGVGSIAVRPNFPRCSRRETATIKA